MRNNFYWRRAPCGAMECAFHYYDSITILNWIVWRLANAISLEFIKFELICSERFYCGEKTTTTTNVDAMRRIELVGDWHRFSRLCSLTTTANQSGEAHLPPEKINVVRSLAAINRYNFSLNSVRTAQPLVSPCTRLSQQITPFSVAGDEKAPVQTVHTRNAIDKHFVHVVQYRYLVSRQRRSHAVAECVNRVQTIQVKN